MGLTYVDGVVTGPTGLTRSVHFLVDSGAKYSLLPIYDWRAIGLAPERRLTFVLADGTPIERDVSECHISLPQGKPSRPDVSQPVIASLLYTLPGCIVLEASRAPLCPSGPLDTAGHAPLSVPAVAAGRDVKLTF